MLPLWGLRAATVAMAAFQPWPQLHRDMAFTHSLEENGGNQGVVANAPIPDQGNLDLKFPIQDSGNPDVVANAPIPDQGSNLDLKFPIQDSGNFINRKRSAERKADRDEEKAKAPSLFPEDAKLSLEVHMNDSEEGTDGEGRKKEAADKGMIQKKMLKSSIYSYRPRSAIQLQLPLLLLLGFVAFASPYVDGSHLGRAKRSLNDTYEDFCVLNNVKEAPAIYHNEPIPLNTSIRCPDTEEHFGIRTCFVNDSALKIMSRHKLDNVFIEHGKGRSVSTRVNFTSDCITHNKHKLQTNTVATVNAKNFEGRNDVGGENWLNGSGVFLLLFHFAIVVLVYLY